MIVDNTLIEVKKGLKFSLPVLQKLLPDVETALFFAKVYELNAYDLGHMLRMLFDSDIITALTAEGGVHSNELQDYLVEVGYEHLLQGGELKFEDDVVPEGQVLPLLWKDIEVQVADSIKEVADKVGDVVGMMPGKTGHMVFKSMQMMNARRPIIGDYVAQIEHAHQLPNIVILDVSGSVSEPTVRELVEEVVALGYEANAHLVIVSFTATHWEPGDYSVETVLAAAEYGGTHYETLAPLFNREWGTVVTIADYDSSWSAKEVFEEECTGHVQQVLDISLVSRPTFLSEVVGLVAEDVRPLLVATNDYSVIGSTW